MVKTFNFCSVYISLCEIRYTITRNLIVSWDRDIIQISGEVVVMMREYVATEVTTPAGLWELV